MGDKVYYNGHYINRSDLNLPIDNRGFNYGDAFFETIRCFNGEPLFWEEHYFRIAGSFFVMKMNTPLEFDLEFFKTKIKKLLIHNQLNKLSSRVRITFFRAKSGYYLPQTNDVDVVISCEKIDSLYYELNPVGLNFGLYKDNFIATTTLSNLKSSNRLLNVLASLYAKENNFDDALLMNTNKHIIESTSGNIFLYVDNSIITPPIQDGCVDGVLRKVLLTNGAFDVTEKSISLSDAFNAKAIFITNVIKGVQWVGRLDNKTYELGVSDKVLKFLNKNYLV